MKNMVHGQNIKSARNKKGIVLISAYFLLASLLTVISGYFIRSVQDYKQSARRVDRMQAMYAAESGLERALEWIVRTRSLPPQYFYPLYWYQVHSTSDSEFQISSITQKPSVSSKLYEVRATGRLNSIFHYARMNVYETNLTRYAYVVDGYSSDHMFLNSDVDVIGRFHNNNFIEVFGNPRFTGDVTTSATAVHNGKTGYYSEKGWDPLASSSYRPAWNPDPELGQPRFIFPDVSLNYLTSYSGYDSINASSTTNKIWFRFLPNGNLLFSTTGPITYSDGSYSPATMLVYATSASKQGYHVLPGWGQSSPPQVYVSGIVGRKFSISSAGTIYIHGPITYACEYAEHAADPSLDYIDGTPNVSLCSGNTTDRLFLLSEQNLMISASAYPGSGNFLYLRGILLSTGGGLGADYASIDKAKIRIYGSLIEQEAQIKGEISGWTGELKKGYVMDEIRHDSRFDGQNPPAWFPKAFSIISRETCDGPCPDAAG